jgi:hypothetical protein
MLYKNIRTITLSQMVQFAKMCNGSLSFELVSAAFPFLKEVQINETLHTGIVLGLFKERK